MENKNSPIHPVIKDKLEKVNPVLFNEFLNIKSALLRCPCCFSDSFYVPQNTADGARVHLRYTTSNLHNERGAWGIFYNLICNNCAFTMSFCAQPILAWMDGEDLEGRKCDG